MSPHECFKCGKTLSPQDRLAGIAKCPACGGASSEETEPIAIDDAPNRQLISSSSRTEMEEDAEERNRKLRESDVIYPHCDTTVERLGQIEQDLKRIEQRIKQPEE